MPGVQRSGSKGRKYGRNANFCQRYTIENRRIRNKIKKLKRRIRLNELMIARKVRRIPPRIVKVDVGAISALKQLA